LHLVGILFPHIRESVLEPTEERSAAANTAPNCTLSTPVEGTHGNLCLLLYRRYRNISSATKKMGGRYVCEYLM